MVNQFLCTRNVGKYATMVMLRLLPNGSFEYMNCGHIQPLSIFQRRSSASGRRQSDCWNSLPGELHLSL